MITPSGLGSRVLVILNLKRVYMYIERPTLAWVKPPHPNGTMKCCRMRTQMYGVLEAGAGYQSKFNKS